MSRHLWTKQEIAYLKANVGRIPHAQIAAALGRSYKAINNYAKTHGYISRAFWTEAESRIVRQHYRKLTADRIAMMLGRNSRQVHQHARRIGLAIPHKIITPEFISFFRAKNAAGWPDSEIARARGFDRHAVSALRKKLGLPSQQLSQRRRDAVRQRTAEQLKQAGLPSIGHLRKRAFEDRARAAGWPTDLRPRAVQMLNAMWERGPMTRRELAAAIGMPWKNSRNSLASNDKEGSYLAHLMARGLVVCLGRKVKGKGSGHNTCLYTLPIWIERNIKQEKPHE